jgi:hypothetical protein
MKKRFGDRVEFLGVYVREAHPTDGWRMASNDKVGVTFAQPRSKGEREEIASKCCESLKMTVPLLIDEIDDRVGHAYSGMPDRLYLIDKSGRVAYKGGRGPFGFKPGQLEQALVMMLLESYPPPKAARVPVPSEVEAWASLPAPEQKVKGPLPVWARALAGPLPRTTAAMLELDYTHRVKSPLEPKLRAKMRWVAAQAIKSPFGEAQAVADLKRAGTPDAEISALQAGSKDWPVEERDALTFAKKLTEAAYKVTDEEVAGLRQQYGDARVVAMVQLLAHANFQDRLLHALGLQGAKDAEQRPLVISFKKPIQGGAAPTERSPSSHALRSRRKGEAGPDPVSDSDWTQFDFAFLKAKMQGQKHRQPRIAVPPFESVRQYMPPTFPKDKQLKINWSLVCLGYQPELSGAWTLCTRTFAEESQQDRVFEESLFWVITRELQCFY